MQKLIAVNWDVPDLRFQFFLPGYSSEYGQNVERHQISHPDILLPV